MSMKVTLVAASALFLAIAGFSGNTLALQPCQSTAPPVVIPTQPLRPEPPPECTSTLSDFHAFTMSLEGSTTAKARVEMTYNPWGRSVDLQFRYHEGSFPDQNIAVDLVTVPTAYYPTSAIYLGSDRVAVSGKDAVSGLAVIQIWSLSRPNLIRIPSNAGGEDQLFLRGGKVVKVDTAFAPSAAAGFGLVRAMWRNRSLQGDHIIAMSYPGDNIYSIDLGSGIATLAISVTTPLGSMPPAPVLSQDWPGYSGPYRHSTLGDVYMLTRRAAYVITGTPGVHALYLIDADKDGTLDYFETISSTNEDSLGINDITLWDTAWQ